MKGKIVPAIMLALLLTGMLTLAFNIQPVKASGTIYIRADGSIDPQDAPISSVDNVTYTLTGNITSDADGIVVERNHIVIDGNGYTLSGSGNGRLGFNLTCVYNVTIKETNMASFDRIIWLSNSSNNNISWNNITMGYTYNIVGAVLLYHSNNNTISHNTMRKGFGGVFKHFITLDNSSSNNISENIIDNGQAIGGRNGILLNPSSSFNTISGNNITNIGWGIILGYSSNCNSIYGNNIANSLVGITLGSSFNTLSGNNIRDSWVGISLQSSNNTLFGNTMTNNRPCNFYGPSGNTPESFINNVTNSNTVDGKPIYYWVGKRDTAIPLDAGYVALINCTNITVQNLTLAYNGQGIILAYTINSTITKNKITNTQEGIALSYSVNNTISENIITGNDIFTIGLDYSSSNFIYHHNFDNEEVHATPEGYANVWDDGYPSGGNYWSDYNGTDLYNGPQQNETGSDGIGDTPYVIDEDNQDNYPLMKPYPWSPHDVGITSVTTSKNIVGQGFNVSINASVFNYGDSTENINVTIYANSTTISEINNIELASRNSTTITFTWDTAGVAYGNYTMTVCATPVSGETDTTDNNSTGCWVLVTILGDVDGDLEDGHYDVDLFDAVRLLACYGAKEGDSNFDPNCDIDSDGQVFLFDAVILLSRYGQKYP